MSKQVTLLTGFLGAGKTTFLNAALKQKSSTRFAIIENEFGEEDIDSELIIKADDDLFSLNNGCLCCTLNDNLYDLLNELYDKRDTFDELIIETTGIADPAGVAVPFMSDPSIAKTFDLKRVVCLVDAELVEDQLRDTTEAIKQISFSDVILINKTDNVAPDYVQQIKTILEGLNPFAKILIGHKNAYPIDEIFALERDQDFKNEPKKEAKAHTCSHDHKHDHTCAHDHDHKHDHHAHGDIVSLSFRFDEPFDLRELNHRLTVFLLFQAKDVYRVKGIVYSNEHSKKLIVQSVGKSLAIEPGREWEPNEPKISRIVFIGKLLKPAGFEKMLRQCLSKPITA